jgi:hypothetical protein
MSDWSQTGVFIDIPLSLNPFKTSRTILISELRRIYERNWIESQKLDGTGTAKPYSARNGGGYTLEAELGIRPNGFAEPDFMGWEVKQFGVSDFTNYRPKSPVTLMTPEPTGGTYKSEGLPTFMRRYGYPDHSGIEDRINFGGKYVCNGDYHHETGLRLVLEGYDTDTGKITDMEGQIALRSRDDELAASWRFSDVLSHWNRKHAQAAYVPSLFKTPPAMYCYGPKILMCEQTDFILFLAGIANGSVYYDPAIKAEAISTLKPIYKRRSQFRIQHQDLTEMYRAHENIILNGL